MLLHGSSSEHTFCSNVQYIPAVTQREATKLTMMKQNSAIFNESQTLCMCSNVDSDSLWHLPIIKSDKDALKIVKSAQFATNMLSRSRTGIRRYGTRKNIKSSRIGEINRQRMVRRNKRIRQTREKGVSPLTRNTKSLSSEGTLHHDTKRNNRREARSTKGILITNDARTRQSNGIRNNHSTYDNRRRDDRRNTGRSLSRLHLQDSRFQSLKSERRNRRTRLSDNKLRSNSRRVRKSSIMREFRQTQISRSRNIHTRQIDRTSSRGARQSADHRTTNRMDEIIVADDSKRHNSRKHNNPDAILNERRSRNSRHQTREHKQKVRYSMEHEDGQSRNTRTRINMVSRKDDNRHVSHLQQSRRNAQKGNSISNDRSFPDNSVIRNVRNTNLAQHGQIRRARLSKNNRTGGRIVVTQEERFPNQLSRESENERRSISSPRRQRERKIERKMSNEERISRRIGDGSRHQRNNRRSNERLNQQHVISRTAEGSQKRHEYKGVAERSRERHVSSRLDDGSRQRVNRRIVRDSKEQRGSRRTTRDAMDQRVSKRTMIDSMDQRASRRTVRDTMDQRVSRRPVRDTMDQRVSRRPVRDSMDQRASRRTVIDSMDQRVSRLTVKYSMDQRVSRRTVRDSMDQRASKRTVRDSMDQRVSRRTVSDSMDQRVSRRTVRDSRDQRVSIRTVRDSREQRVSRRTMRDSRDLRVSNRIADGHIKQCVGRYLAKDSRQQCFTRRLIPYYTKQNVRSQNREVRRVQQTNTEIRNTRESKLTKERIIGSVGHKIHDHEGWHVHQKLIELSVVPQSNLHAMMNTSVENRDMNTVYSGSNDTPDVKVTQKGQDTMSWFHGTEITKVNIYTPASTICPLF